MSDADSPGLVEILTAEGRSKGIQEAVCDCTVGGRASDFQLYYKQ